MSLFFHHVLSSTLHYTVIIIASNRKLAFGSRLSFMAVVQAVAGAKYPKLVCFLLLSVDSGQWANRYWLCWIARSACWYAYKTMWKCEQICETSACSVPPNFDIFIIGICNLLFIQSSPDREAPMPQIYYIKEDKYNPQALSTPRIPKVHLDLTGF